MILGERGHGPDPTQSQLEVECKQYLQANSKGFAEALRDYAKGRPISLVLLVSNGPLNRDLVLNRGPADFGTHRRNRQHASADPNARARFRELIGDGLDRVCGGPKLRCQLAWTDGPADLDLHLLSGSRTSATRSPAGSAGR